MADHDSPTASRHLANTSVQLLPSPPTTNGVDITRYIKFKLKVSHTVVSNLKIYLTKCHPLV